MGTTTTMRTGNCPKHGEYQVRVTYSPITDKYYSSGCPKCEKIDAEEERKQQEKLKKEQEAKAALRQLVVRGIPKRYHTTSLQDYVARTEDQRRVLQIITDYVDKQHEVSEAGRSLLLYGNVGTGKTRLATSIVKEWSGVGHYITAREYTRLVRSTYSSAAKETEDDIVKRFLGYSILVIDEIGKQFSTDSERYAIFDIINARYNEEKPTVLVSNMNIAEITDFLGEATVDRIKERGGKAVLFNWESYRR